MSENENESFLNESTDEESSYLTTDFASKTSSEESIGNLDKAKYFNVDPDNYLDVKEELDPKYETAKRTPAQVHRSVVKIQAESKEHANATKEDTGILSTIGDVVDHVKFSVSGRDEIDKKINSLADLGVSGELNDEGNTELDKLVKERSEAESKFEHLSFNQQLAGNVGKAIDDMFGAVKDNIGKISLATGAGAAYGAAGGTIALPLIGTGAGALGVGGLALSNATVAAMASNAYDQTVNDTWLMLRSGIKDNDGNKVELTSEQQVNIARAVGATAGVFEFAGGKILGSTIGKVAKRKAILALINSPARAALINLGKQTTISATSSGLEEVLAEVASVGGEVYAKNINEGAGEKLKSFVETLKEPKTLERFLDTFIVGGATGATVTGGVGVLGLKGQITNAKDNNTKIKDLAKKFGVAPEDLTNALKVQEAEQVKIKKVEDILTAKESINAIVKIQDETLLNKVSPEQAKEITSKIIKDAGLSDFHFSEADLDVIKDNNPDLYAQMIEFDQSKSGEMKTDSGVVLEAAPLIELVRDNPTLADYIRDNPESPNPLEASNFIDRIEQAEPRRKALLEKLKVDGELSVEDQATLNELNEETISPVFKKGQEGYLEGVDNFTKDVRESLNDNQIELMDKAQDNTRDDVSVVMEESFKVEEENKMKRVLRANKKIEIEQQRLRDAEEIAITNRFIKKEGMIDIAIDPIHLPENLREAYVNDPVLKKRKVFKVGGIKPEESAYLAGLDDWKEMLKIVANSKTLKERAAVVAKRMDELKLDVMSSRMVELDKRLDQKFDDFNTLRKLEMEHLRTKNPTAFKRGVKLVALPLNKLSTALNEKATRVIAKTKVNKLQVSQYNMAKKSHQVKGMNHIFNNEVNEAFQSKEKAILNNELTREAYKAKREVSEARTFVRNVLLNKKNVKGLERSGSWGRIDNILSLYNLEGGSKNLSKQENYNNFVKDMLEQGVEFVIPERLNDVRERGDNLTVEQFLAVTDELRRINQQSKLKNKLLKKKELRDKQIETENINTVAKNLTSKLENNSNYDASRSEVSGLKGLEETKKEKVTKFLEASIAANTNLRNILLKADDEQITGVNSETIQKPLDDAEQVNLNMNEDIKKQVDLIAKDYGMDEYKKSLYEQIDIPEFKNYKNLNYGKMTKAHLWRLLMYKGDPDALASITNFKDKDGSNISMETVDQVLETYLTEKDSQLVQNFTNIFKSFEDASFALHEKRTGIKAKKIKSVPILHKGIVRDGGYTPIDRITSSTEQKIKKAEENLVKNEIGDPDTSFFGRKRASEQTDQGRFKERQSRSEAELDLNFMNVISSYNEHVHDIAYREVGLDTLKLLRHPEYKKGLVNTVGKLSYDSVVNSVIDQVGKDTTSTIDPATVNLLSKAFSNVMGGLYAGLLGSNFTSIAMQPLAFKNIILRMDKGGKKHLGKNIGATLKLLVTGDKKGYEKVFNRALEIDPTIMQSLEGIDEDLHKTMRDLLQTKTPTKMSKLKEFASKVNFFGLNHVDLHIKVSAANASYNQFVNGDVKGFNNEVISKMTEEELHNKAKEYAQNINRLGSTTAKRVDKATIEKLDAMAVFTLFFTDIRQTINTEASEYRKIRKSVKSKNYKEASQAAISLLVINTLADMYASSLYGGDTGVDELMEADDIGSVMSAMGGLVIKGATSPIRNTPLLREVDFAGKSDRTKKDVRTIPSKIMSDVATSIGAMGTLLSLEGLDKGQIESLLYTYNYATGGQIPVNAIRKTLKALDTDFSEVTEGVIDGSTDLMSMMIGGIVSMGKDSKSPSLVKAAEDLEQHIPESTKEAVIPEGVLISLATAENDFIDPETGAAGKYKFTQEQWDRIAEKHEFLDLSDEGRLDSDDTSEQDRAMFQNVKDNSQFLAQYDLPVTNANLHGSHHFGIENYALLLLSEGKDKLPERLTKQPLFKGFKTVKQVKDFVAKQVKNVNN